MEPVRSHGHGFSPMSPTTAVFHSTLILQPQACRDPIYSKWFNTASRHSETPYSFRSAATPRPPPHQLDNRPTGFLRRVRSTMSRRVWARGGFVWDAREIVNVSGHPGTNVKCAI